MSDALPIGSHFDRYHIESVLGHGQISTVYRATHIDTGRSVALKVLPRELLREAGFAARFRQEARAVARLQHPHIARLYSVGQSNGQPYLIAPYFPGGSLADILAGRGPLSAAQALPLITQVAAALDYAHERGVLHGDVRPGNILFDEAGSTHLADFSLKAVREAAALAGLPSGDPPAYAAPEIMRGEPEPGPTADVYALGVTLFEMLTGQLPFLADDPAEMARLHRDAPVPSPVRFNPSVNPAVEIVIRQALAKAPIDRFDSAGDMAQALTRAVQLSGEAEPTVDIRLGGEESGDLTPPPSPGPLAVRPDRVLIVGEPDEEGWHETSYPARPLSRQERRRLRREAARQQRLERRLVRQAAGGGLRWYTAAVAIMVLIGAWFIVGLLIGFEARRRANVAELARIHGTQTPAAATAYVEATATAQAYLNALGTATQRAVLAGQTATALAPTATPTATPTPTPTPTATPTPLAGSRGLVAFVSERDGDPEVYVIDLRTGQETRITDNDTPDGAPAWSPDGRMLAYHSNVAGRIWHIFVVDMACVNRPDGCLGTPREVTSGIRADAYPVWSPDGQRIVFLSNEGRRWWFRVIDLAGEEADLTQLPASMRLLEWAPDGKMLTFFGESLAGPFEVLTMPLEGISTDRTPITAGRGAIEFLDFSPDRRQAVFSRLTGPNRQLFLADATCEIIDQCVTRRLTEDTYNYLTPRFSPDGTLILTAANRAGNLDLYILDQQGRLVQRVTERPEDEYDAVWQPGVP